MGRTNFGVTLLPSGGGSVMRQARPSDRKRPKSVRPSPTPSAYPAHVVALVVTNKMFIDLILDTGVTPLHERTRRFPRRGTGYHLALV